MDFELDIKNIRDFVYSEKFANFLVNNVTDLGVALFIIQVLKNEIDKIENFEN